MNLPDGLMEAARARATQEGRSVTSVVVEALRALLSTAPPQPDASPPALPSYGDPEGRFLVDMTDRDALWAALDTDGPR